jgi:hypothetical protein
MIEDYEATVYDADLIGYFHPREIVRDPMLTVERKRQLVSFWLSDIHAVRNQPALRTYPFGSTVTVDDLMAALAELDEMVDVGAMGSTRHQQTAA